MKNRLIPIGILIVSIALLLSGIMRKEYIEVFRRGILICLECIGIG